MKRIILAAVALAAIAAQSQACHIFGGRTRCQPAPAPSACGQPRSSAQAYYPQPAYPAPVQQATFAAPQFYSAPMYGCSGGNCSSGAFGLFGFRR